MIWYVKLWYLPSSNSYFRVQLKLERWIWNLDLFTLRALRLQMKPEVWTSIYRFLISALASGEAWNLLNSTPCFMQFVLASPEAWILIAMPESWASFSCTLKSVVHSETCLSQMFDEYFRRRAASQAERKKRSKIARESWKLKAEALDSALPRPWLSVTLRRSRTACSR